MFWKYNTSASSQIEALLGKEDVSLQEVMDADDIINECRVQNKILIDFLLKPEVMEELVTLTVKEPSIEIEERNRFKYPNIACELLTCDVSSINERLASDEVLLDKLYTFLECETPLNPLLASYFSKIMGALIAKKTEQVLDFLKAKDTFISLLLKHLGTSAIMDFVLKLMTQIEGAEMRQNSLNWLDSQRIMQSLVSLLNPKIDKERHYNVAQLLCDFIRVARDNLRNSTERADPDPLLNTLESPETVSLLLDNIFKDEKNESAIVGGIQVLLALLDVYQSSIPKFNSQNIYDSNINEEAGDIEQKQKIIFNTTQAIRVRIKDFHNLLVDPPYLAPVVTTVGTLNPPLGNTRLQVAKLLATIISSNNEELLSELESIGTFPVLLDLFFKYSWNNFLHTQVENCLISALKTHVSEENEENSNALTKHLLVNCKLIERILEAWKKNDEQQAQEKGIRRGYMGHLISMLNKIVELCSHTSLGQYLKDNLPDVAKSLDEFGETTLNETNKIQETLLGGVHPHSSVEDNEDYGNIIHFPQSGALQQQMFSQYQMQNLTSQYIDGYSGFNDDAFNDGDDTLQSIDHRTDMNFDLSEGDLVQQHEIFKQVCAQNINTLDDADDQIFEDREHTFQTVIEKQDRNEAVYSSDSDDEPSGDEVMDVDPWSSPKPSETAVAPELGSDPWSGFGSTTESTAGGWADFTSTAFNANFDANFQDDFFKSKFEGKKGEGSIENDLKMENVEVQTEKPKEEIKTNNIDRVAQTEVEKAKAEVTIKSAAGDQGDEPVSKDNPPSDKPKTSAVPAEPSKSIEGDYSVQSEPTDKEKSGKEKA
ncbi:hypothetical protein NQ317_019937 [Molorchus minor]|uniref:Serine/threonine-protein phosphatase 6 regulatory subunit 3 n=1 Tax=Molorchus minor TaxID=1323400 RepID=A0ABQ9K7F5_9CUCU|nr:hypothetical protein NQ317_019937 [Molorchus minor]